MNLVDAYKSLVDAIVSWTGFSHEILHVHCGLIIYVLVQILLGTRRGSMPALQIVVVVEIGNEVMNRLYYGEWRWADTLNDLALTIFWPCILVIASKYRRARWRRKNAHHTQRTAEVRP